MASGTINFSSNNSNLAGKIDWSSSSNGTNANSSNVTATLYVRRTNNYTTTGTWTGILNIGGEERSFSVHTSVSSGWVRMQGFTKTINHNNDGSGTCWISGYCNGPSGTSMAGTTVTGSQTVTLDKIPRYLSITSFNIQSKQINKAIVKWSVSDARDYTQYSLNGAGWHDDTNFNIASDNKSGTFEILNLNPNTTYNLKIRCRRTDSQLWTESNTITFTTYDYAKLTSVPNINIGNSQTIKWSNPNNASATLKLCKTDNSTIIDYGTITGTSITITPASNTIYSLTPNSNTYRARYIITTTQNGKTYTDSKDFTFNVTNSNPTFTDFDYQDLSGITVPLTGSNKIIVNKYSNLQVTIPSSKKASAKNSATMKSYKLSCGNKTETKNYSSNSNVTFSAFGPNTGTIIVYATDSRGNSTAVTKNATFKNYNEPIITRFEAIRGNNGVGSEVSLKFEGTYWNNNFGVIQNEIVGISYNYKETSSSSYSMGKLLSDFTASNGKFEGSLLIEGDLGAEGFDVSKTFNIRLNVVDKLGTTQSVITLGAGAPAIAIYKDRIAIGGKYDTSSDEKLKVYGDVKANKFKGIATQINVSTRNTTDTWIPVFKNNTLQYTTRYIPTAKTHSQYNIEQDRLVTLAMLSFWNGACNSGNNSNLTYCSQGEIQAKPVSLYDNVSGTTGTVTLSQSADNFSYIEIFYNKNGLFNNSVKIYLPNGKSVGLIYGYKSDMVQLGFREIKISGTSISNSSSGGMNIDTSGNINLYSTVETKIYKVIGYR